MQWGESRARAIVLALMLALFVAGWPGAKGAAAADTGRYAPQTIAQTYKQLGWLCMVRALCPVSDEVYSVIKRAIAGNPSSEYLLGLTLLTGDGLSRDQSAGIAWSVRAAEHGDPDAEELKTLTIALPAAAPGGAARSCQATQ
jgi:TPR repeat protein